MKIYLLDRNDEMCQYWSKAFHDTDNVTVIHDDFEHFIKANEETIDAVVSPANSFGIMDGAYDLAITRSFGQELMKKVQKEIIARYHGIQPVGTALTVPINEKTILIHVPTMYYPEPIYDQRVVFQAMHVTLCEAEQQNVSSIVIPAFGGATGKMQPRVIAYLMRTAYDYYMHPIKEIDWDKAVLLEESFYRLAVAMLEKNKAETAAQELDTAADTLYS